MSGRVTFIPRSPASVEAPDYFLSRKPRARFDLPMGFIHPGVPQELVFRLSREFSVTTFIETGTHKGNTAAWAAEHFAKVLTIEGSELWYQTTKARLAPHENVSMLFGHSAEVLPEVVGMLTAPALFWLDAHWSGRQTAGAQDQCPLLGEIAAINASPFEHFVLIDDARLFLAPPEPPHNIEQWPDIAAIITILQGARPKYVVVFEDAIIAVPIAAKKLVQDYCLERMAAVKSRTFVQKVRDRLKGILHS